MDAANIGKESSKQTSRGTVAEIRRKKRKRHSDWSLKNMCASNICILDLTDRRSETGKGSSVSLNNVMQYVMEVVTRHQR